MPFGKNTTIEDIREYLVKKNNADFIAPITTGIFTSLVALASYQREDDEIIIGEH